MIRRILGGIVFGCVVCFWLAIIAFGVLLVIVTRSNAHDHWINEKHYQNPVTRELCCGSGDCFEIPSEFVERHNDGSYTLTIGGEKEEVPAIEVLPSMDGQHWRCKRPDGSRRCFLAPIPGS